MHVKGPAESKASQRDYMVVAVAPNPAAAIRERQQMEQLTRADQTARDDKEHKQTLRDR